MGKLLLLRIHTYIIVYLYINFVFNYGKHLKLCSLFDYPHKLIICTPLGLISTDI